VTVRKSHFFNSKHLVAGSALFALVAVASVPTITAMTRRGSAASVAQTTGGTQAAAPKQTPPTTTPAGRPADGRGRGPSPVPGPVPGPRTDVYRWWKDADVIKQINLSTSQGTTIDRLYERRLKQIQLQADDYAKQNTELNRLIEERAVKPEVIELQASKMMTPKVFIDISRIKMLYEMSLVLTADQNHKLQEFFQKLREQRVREQGEHGRGRNLSGQ